MTQFKEILPGIHLRTVAVGETTHMVEFNLEHGKIIPDHIHPHEQSGYLVSGKVKMKIEGKEEVLLAGASWCITGNTEHGVVVLEDSRVIEVFSPPRQDYLDMM